MFFTGFTRFSSEVQKANRLDDRSKFARLREMHQLVDEAERVLTDRETDLDEFGRLLDHTWKLKRQTGSAVSTCSIDAIYEKGVRAGAGGGGFFVFYVPEGKRESVRKTMSDLLYIPFEFENGGTRVIYYSPERYLPREEQQQ